MTTTVLLFSLSYEYRPAVGRIKAVEQRYNNIIPYNALLYKCSGLWYLPGAFVTNSHAHESLAGCRVIGTGNSWILNTGALYLRRRTAPVSCAKDAYITCSVRRKRLSGAGTYRGSGLTSRYFRKFTSSRIGSVALTLVPFDYYAGDDVNNRAK